MLLGHSLPDNMSMPNRYIFDAGFLTTEVKDSMYALNGWVSLHVLARNPPLAMSIPEMSTYTPALFGRFILSQSDIR